MHRRDFLQSAAALAATSLYPGLSQSQNASQNAQAGFPPNQLATVPYIESQPIPEYHHAPASACEGFRDMKFGVRIHWGLYCIWHRGAESWPFLKLSFADRALYNDLYKTWNPHLFDANEWMSTFKEGGMKMFAFTTKHHEGFSMFDTRTRVRSRADWSAPGGPRIESCDLAYSIMETPFRRDIVGELSTAAHKSGIKIDFYFSHPDWYDADFRPYVQHPLQVPSAASLVCADDLRQIQRDYGDHPVMTPDPSDAEVARMMARHRAQLVELLSNYGTIDMMCLDMYLGPRVWPEMRKTILELRKIQPNVMLRNRGIGNYGDYYTPERAIPQSLLVSQKPWFCINPLGTDFSYDPVDSNYKGVEWIVHTLVDTTAKGGGLMIGVGPSPLGQFHPEAVRQIKETGKWLQVNGEAIYSTRPREESGWSQGDTIRFTRSKDRRFVYAIFTAWPGREVTLASIKPKPGSRVELLGSAQTIAWSFDAAKGTTIQFPEPLQQESNRPCSHAWSLKLEPLRE
jgi:alpha-L-fucosidase